MARVCILEDDATMRSLLQTLLQLEGHDVLIDGAQPGLLERLAQAKPDVLLMDVHLDQGDGIEILRQVRQSAGLSGLRVLMCSGLDTERECLASGADAFLLKPYDPSRMTDLVRSLSGDAENAAGTGEREQ
jgi:CheY-like chemotaxis protein